jgi:hypothetical protein
LLFGNQRINFSGFAVEEGGDSLLFWNLPADKVMFCF